MCGLNYCIVHTSDTWCFDQTRPTIYIYIYISIHRYLHLFPYAYVYNTVVTRCPLWSFPYRIHTRILCWDPHRIHTRIHIGIHTAIAKHKPGFVGQLTTTLWGFVCNQKLGFRTSVEDGPCTKHRRPRVLANRHSFDENSYPSCFHSVQCNHETPRTKSKAQSGEVQDCPAPQCMSLVIQIWTVINGPGHTAIGAQTSEQEHLHSTYVCLKINLSYKYTYIYMLDRSESGPARAPHPPY